MNDWKNIAVTSNACMKEVLRVIDEGVKQIALVVDDGCHLVGTVTDGDVRRAILRGQDLDTPVKEFMNGNPISGLEDEDPENWQRTMLRYGLRHLPLLDARGCVSRIVRLERPAEPRRDNMVVLMAGGLGTRLRPLTEKAPKPLLKVGDKPILETIIENFVAHGFHRITLCINYRGQMIRDHFGDGSKFGAELHYVEEPRRLGTAGALSLLPERPTEPFFVMNGDLLTKVDFVRLLDFHHRQQNLATMCVREYSYQVPYGVVEMDHHRILNIKEKPVQYFYVNAGIYVLEPDAIDRIPGQEFFDMPALFDQLIADQQQVGSFPLREYWMDIGRMEDFQRAHVDYQEHFA